MEKDKKKKRTDAKALDLDVLTDSASLDKLGHGAYTSGAAEKMLYEDKKKKKKEEPPGYQ